MHLLGFLVGSLLCQTTMSQKKRQDRRGRSANNDKNTNNKHTRSSKMSLDEDDIVTNRIEQGISNVEDYIEDLKDRQDELLLDNSTDTMLQMSRILDATKKMMIDKILHDNDIPLIVEHLTSDVDDQMIELRSDGANPFFDLSTIWQYGCW
jgi:hypothetical protein